MCTNSHKSLEGTRHHVDMRVVLLYDLLNSLGSPRVTRPKLSLHA
jgi:hypothetical protein